MDFQWPDFEPGGDRNVGDRPCEASPPSFWMVGIEDKWDAFLPNWSISPVYAPNCNVQVILAWEDPDFCFQTGAVACTNFSEFDFHQDHFDLVYAETLFDVDSADPYQTWGPNFKTRIAAHEWGHVMGLYDHPGGRGGWTPL